MQVSPWILGAAALVPVFGAVAGASLNTEPIGIAADVSASLPERPAIAIADAAPRTQERLPDHYAMETPEGRVEVHELAMRGRHPDRFRAARAYEQRLERDLAALEARWDRDTLDSRAAAALDAQQPSVPQGNRYTQLAAAPQPPEPLDLAEPQPVAAAPRIELAAETPRAVTPRRIDVATELSLRR